MTTVVRPDILRQIGNTPLVELNSFSTSSVRLFTKLEWFNPFGSVKDRAAYWMVKEAEREGLLKKDKSIIILIILMQHSTRLYTFWLIRKPLLPKRIKVILNRF